MLAAAALAASLALALASERTPESTSESSESCGGLSQPGTRFSTGSCCVCFRDVSCWPSIHAETNLQTLEDAPAPTLGHTFIGRSYSHMLYLLFCRRILACKKTIFCANALFCIAVGELQKSVLSRLPGRNDAISANLHIFVLHILVTLWHVYLNLPSRPVRRHDHYIFPLAKLRWGPHNGDAFICGC